MFKEKKKIIFSSCLASIFEWYDYSLFAHFAAIISETFLPPIDDKTNLLRFFAVFAVGYLMRPIGGIIFGIIGDRLGRREALSISIMCMALPTAVVALLPGYNQIGIYATVAVILARMLQGLSMGGAFTGSMTFLIEHTDKCRHGLVGSLLVAGISMGIFIGSVTSSLCEHLLNSEQFYSWGWRIPFLMGIPIVFAGVYIRYNTKETPIFAEIKSKGMLARSPLTKVLKLYGDKILISILINITGSVLFYFEAVYLLNYLKHQVSLNQFLIDGLVKFCYLLMVLATVLSGWVSDVIGAKKVYVINLLMIIFGFVYIGKFIESGDIYLVAIGQIFVAISAAFYIGPEPALQSKFYPDDVRSTALSISYNTATSIFGGTAPYVFETLSQNYRIPGSLIPCTYYIVICGLLSLVGIYLYYKKTNR